MGKARFKTIARDARFRSLFAQDDDANSIKATLKRIFNALDAEREKRRIRGEAAIRRRKIKYLEEVAKEEERRRNKALDQLAAKVKRRERTLRRSRQSRIRNVYKDFQRGFTYTIGDLDDSMFGPQPQHFLLTILKTFKGQRIRIVAYNGTPGEIVRGDFDDTGPPVIVNDHGHQNLNDVVSRTIYKHQGMSWIADDTRVGDHTYTVPNGDNNAINRWFKGKDGARSLRNDWTFRYNSGEYQEEILNPGYRVRVYAAQAVVNQPTRIQYFAQGVAHCVIQPIINDFTVKLENIDASKYKNRESYRSAKSHYKRGIEILTEYATKYAPGIPVPAMHTMVEEVSEKHKINIDIVNPCAKKGEDQFIKIDNQYAHGKRYEFVNWRFDHIDALEASYKDIKNAIEVPREKITELIKEYTSIDQFCEWNCDSQGPVCVCTATETYRCNVQFGERYNKFCEQFNGFRIDHVADSMMSNFVLEGTHWCCSASFNPAKTEDLHCYDM